MDTDGLPELLAHYLLLVLLVVLAVGLLNVVADDPSFWYELTLVAVVVFAYRPAIFLLGVAPDRWEEQRK